ncbi:hypothetical protein [Alphaproteobacteria bacterium endosymbiont of Tiliacea citrago]|uniref:hypothetical protein n=1 Tax=Alphaproteobacteria bacterium endosymbiont of Tiliacea citrago TaxID=3077944 RepID=UPI00313D0332
MSLISGYLCLQATIRHHNLFSQIKSNEDKYYSQVFFMDLERAKKDFEIIKNRNIKIKINPKNYVHEVHFLYNKIIIEDIKKEFV